MKYMGSKARFTKSSLSANGKIGGNKLSVEKLFKFSPTNVQ